MENYIDALGTVLLRSGIIVIMCSMGLQITSREILASVHRPWLMTKALAANMVLLPLVALGVSRLVAMPEGIAVGFLIASIAPGASLSPKLSEIARADISFAVGLTFVMAVLSVLTTPLMAGWLLPDSPAIQFDARSVIGTMITFQLIPLLVGLAIHHWRPALAGRLRQPSIWLSNVLFFAVVAFYVIRDFNALQTLPPLSVAAMILMTLVSLFAGWQLGGPDHATRQSLALGTSVEFTGLALLIVSLIFPGPSARIAVVAFALIMVLTNTALAFVWNQRRAVQTHGEAVGST